MKTEAERGCEKKLRAYLRADRAGEGHRTATVAQGVSRKVSWASKPITGAALIEAAL